MPTLANMNLPTPKSWEEFEQITLDALKIKWHSPNLQKNGRTGQKQHGVDVYGQDELLKHAGVQCKKYDLKLNIKAIEAEIDKAEKFIPPIDVFFMATTSPTDANLQREVRLITQKRIKEKKFPIGIFFWDDIIQEIVKDTVVFGKHYPQLSSKTGEIKKAKRLFSLLELSFHGLNLKHYSEVLYGEMGWLANEDPRKMESVCTIIENASEFTCSEENRTKLKEQITIFLNYLIPYVTHSKKDNFLWNVSDDNANRVSAIIKATEHSLEGKEMMAFRIGELLGNWNRFEWEKKEEEPISDEFFTNLTQYIRKLNSDQVPESISKLIEDYKTNHRLMSRATMPDKLFSKIKQFLIDLELS